MPTVPVCSYRVFLAVSDQINALAGNNTFVLTTAIVRLMVSDRDLALVFSHELAHLTRNHQDAKKTNATIGAMIAASAGAFLAPVTQVDTTIGFLGIKAMAGAIVGGFGSIPGALLGCLLIGIIEPFADYYLPAIKGVSAYVVMLLVLFVRPEGLIVQTFKKKA